MGYAAERWDCSGPDPGRGGARPSVYARTLHRACEILGGMPALAAQLKVAPAELERWISGKAQPPLEIFLDAVEVVLLHSERADGGIS